MVRSRNRSDFLPGRQEQPHSPATCANTGHIGPRYQDLRREVHAPLPPRRLRPGAADQKPPSADGSSYLFPLLSGRPPPEFRRGRCLMFSCRPDQWYFKRILSICACFILSSTRVYGSSCSYIISISVTVKCIPAFSILSCISKKSSPRYRTW